MYSWDALLHIFSPASFVKSNTPKTAKAFSFAAAERFAKAVLPCSVSVKRLLPELKLTKTDVKPLLLISSVRRAYELAEAMECRCYNGGEGKTRMKQLKMTAVDFKIIVVTLIYGLAVILLNIIL